MDYCFPALDYSWIISDKFWFPMAVHQSFLALIFTRDLRLRIDQPGTIVEDRVVELLRARPGNLYLPLTT